MKEAEKISIALTTYNGQAYLSDQLDSYLKQSLLPNELVVCDDKSTDNTIKIIEEFKLTAPFEVVLVRNEIRLGFNKNFEKALSLCTGDIVFISDQDDVWLPEKISTVRKVFQRNVRMVINDAWLVNEKLDNSGETKLGQLKRLGLSISSHHTGCCMALRREVLEVLLPIPPQLWSYDPWINNLCQRLGFKKIIEAPLQLHRRHSDTATGGITNQSKPTSFGNFISSRLDGSPIKYCHERLLKLKDLDQRILERANILRSYGVVIAHCEKDLISEKIAVENRIKVLQSTGFNRVQLSVAMLLKGQYSFFNGLRSFIRDFLKI